ncbi:hypothetical protein [Jatrophihabitans endophyticus]|uniref:hypothetical protein n=1 Tax=Jatrophihabitans endophyticus TaxID=1206085 RepID=UPI0019DB3573|nr:hypothetical protein [Jatrophihabitans endophyticus]MBE7189843.1 hypothetical protein [Jatrophihabitans endophyticus]
MSEQRAVLLIFTLLAIMVIGGALGVRRRTGAVLLALASFAWLLVDTSWEGVTLWTVSSTHGLTTSDLVGLLGLLVAAAQLWRLRRRS